jgi:RES domain
MGRHDAPHLYGAMYTSLSPVSAVAEQLARFRGTSFRPEMLTRAGHTLGMARYLLSVPRARLVDLDDPVTLVEKGLRPSQVATRHRVATQAIASSLFGTSRPRPIGLRWWSILEASWINVTLFAERAVPHLRAVEVEPLTPDDEVVRDACRLLGIGA